MSRKDWEKEYTIIAPPGAREDEWIRIPVLGDKDADTERVMNNAFYNGSVLQKDARSISKYSLVLCLIGQAQEGVPLGLANSK